MYFSMIIPIDLPLIFDRGIQRTEILYRAEKQTTDDQPQSTGTQPNTEAKIGPVTGPAPAMEEN